MMQVCLYMYKRGLPRELYVNTGVCLVSTRISENFESNQLPQFILQIRKINLRVVQKLVVHSGSGVRVRAALVRTSWHGLKLFWIIAAVCTGDLYRYAKRVCEFSVYFVPLSERREKKYSFYVCGKSCFILLVFASRRLKLTDI